MKNKKKLTIADRLYNLCHPTNEEFQAMLIRERLRENEIWKALKNDKKKIK